MTLSEIRRQELDGLMWGEVSPVDTETLTEFQIMGDVLAINFMTRDITLGEGGCHTYANLMFRPEQQEWIRQNLLLSQPIYATVWQYVTGSLDDGIWLRGFTQDAPKVIDG